MGIEKTRSVWSGFCIEMLSADDDHGCAGVDVGALLNQDLSNGAGLGSHDLVLHLHSLQDAQNIAFLDGLAQLDYTALQYATIVVAIVPILLVYPLVLKYYNKDVMAGGVKE